MVVWIFATLLVCFLGNSVGDLEPKAPEVVCQTYVPEGVDLACECHRKSTAKTCKTYWLGHPDGPRLQKPNVTRDDNGTRFTCETDCSGQKSSTDYTLQVAYGPSEGMVSVQGPTSILADENQIMTLTCVPGDVNPAPSFKWKNNAGLHCENGDKENTCVLRLKHVHHGKSFSCKVTNEEADTVVTADLTVNLTFPSAGGEHGLPGQQRSSSHGAGTGYKEPIIGGITAGLVIVIAVVAVFVIRRRLNPRYERPPPRREDEHLYTGLQVLPAAPEPQSVAHSTEPPHGAASVTNKDVDFEENVYNEIPDRVI